MAPTWQYLKCQFRKDSTAVFLTVESDLVVVVGKENKVAGEA